MKRLALCVAAVAVLLPASPAAAVSKKYYFTCTDDAKVQNDKVVRWGPTAPAASVTTGAGCGELDIGQLDTTFNGLSMDFYGSGEHTGPIDTLNVELHSLLISQARPNSDPGMEADLIVDGEPLAEVAAFREIPTPGPTKDTEAYTFSFAHEPDLALDDEGNEVEVPVPLVPGGGTHTIEIRFSSHYTNYNNIWVWGTSEVPSGVEINPATLASPTVSVS